MEAELLTKILAGGGVTSTAIWFIFSMIKRIEKMHNEGMSKLDKAIDTVNTLATTLAVHAKELEFGDKRFVKMEDEVAMCRASIHSIRNTLHDVKNTMVTHRQLRDLKE